MVSAGCTLSKSKSSLKPDRGNSTVLTEGIEAFRNGDLEKSKSAFNKIIDTQRGSDELEEAQWYLAQIAEKQGKPNEALQQYRFFLKNFPSSKYVPEADEKLAALTEGAASISASSDSLSVNKQAASVPSDGFSVNRPGATVQSGGLSANAQKASVPQEVTPLRRQETPRYGTLSGALTTEYLYDAQTSPKSSTPVLNRLNDYLDMRWRKSVDGDLKIYFSGLYSRDFLVTDNSWYRLSKLFADWSDSRSLVDLRVGRQPASGNTLFIRFDGVAVAVRPFNSVGFNSSVGYPVNTFDRNNIRIQRDRFFYDSNLSLYDFCHLSGKVYYTQELNNRFSTRRAVGLNGYWLTDKVNISSVVDYDLDFKRYNDKLLSLDYHGAISSYSAAVEYRKNPFLDFDTALFDPSLVVAGPPVTSLDALRQTMTRDDIRALALDNTTNFLELRLGTAFDFTKIWHADLRYAHTINQFIDFVNGKATTTGDRYSVFISERNGLHWSEIGSLLYLYQPSTDYQTSTVTGTLSKYWTAGTQLSLQCRWERFVFKTSSTQSTRLVPGFILSYTFKGGTSASLETDYEINIISSANTPIKTVETRTSLTIPF